MNPYSVLKQLNIPIAYGRFKKTVKPPFLVYLGTGQERLLADNQVYFAENSYIIEYYFTEKDETKEKEIETLLSENGYVFEKGEDAYIDTEDIFMIAYYI